MVKYPGDQLNEVVIQGGEEGVVLHHVTAKNTNATADKHLMLVRGGATLGDGDAPTFDTPNGKWQVQQPRTDPLHSRTVTDDELYGVQVHLQDLEVHGFEEDRVLSELFETGEFSADTVDEIQSQSRKDRAEYLIRHSSEVKKFRQHGFFLKHGSWRSTTPSDEAVDEVLSHVKDEFVSTQACYKTAYEAVRAFPDKDRVNYCEGIALPKYGGHPTLHAWVEIDGEVVELTWPWSGPKPAEKSLYYGVSPKWNRVQEVMEDRPTYASVFMSDEEYYNQSSVKKAIWSATSN